MQTSVLQFGTSRFLQAHALSFIQEGEAPAPAPLVTLVQSTSDPARRARLLGLTAPGGYPVRVRGLHQGQEIDREYSVTVVRRALSYDADLEEITRIACTEANWIISNTADRGFEPRPEDQLSTPHPGQSYPAKLYLLLKARHLAGAGPLVVLPTELVPRNGEVLRARVIEIAKEQRADDALIQALSAHIWAVSLVDRIVSSELHPAGAVAEPYALWAIEEQEGLKLPVRHPAIRRVKALEPYEKLKLHILNLGHTVLVDLWEKAGRPVAYVREALAGDLHAPLIDIFETEILPGFAARGMGDEARDYLAVTLDRFANPFLDHRLTDIAQNHAAKIAHRITAFLDWSGQGPEAAPRLTRISQSV